MTRISRCAIRFAKLQRIAKKMLYLKAIAISLPFLQNSASLQLKQSEFNRKPDLKGLPTMKPTAPELINSLTPILIATIGGIIGVTVLVTPSNSDAKWSAGMGLAGTAIAGAAGLAQSGNRDLTVSEQDPKLFIRDKQV